MGRYFCCLFYYPLGRGSP